MMALAEFYGPRLKEVRIARARTGVWLARAVGVSPAAISHYESGRSRPTSAVLEQLAETLQVPVPFFLRPTLPSGEAPFMMRSLAATTKRARDAAEMKTLWIREIRAYLGEYVRFPETNLPALVEIDDPAMIDDETIERAAMGLREHWGLRDGPIVDLTGLVESNGILVSTFSFRDVKLDAFSKWSPEAPIIADNVDRCTAVRLRFDICHELGHLVMHQRIPPSLARRQPFHRQLEQQAHRFAGAFLFPKRPFMTEVYTTAIAGLVELKRRWGISLQAMVYRARQLEMISQAQLERAFRRMSQVGARTSEPLDDQMQIERPSILRTAVEAAVAGGIPVAEIVSRIRLNPRDIEELSGLETGALSSPQRGDARDAKVIVLRAPQSR